MLATAKEDNFHIVSMEKSLHALKISLFVMSGAVSVLCTLVAVSLNGLGLFYHPQGLAISALRYSFCGLFLIPLLVVVALGRKRTFFAPMHRKLRLFGYFIGALLVGAGGWFIMEDPGDAIIYGLFVLCGILLTLSCWVDRQTKSESI